MNIIVTGGAGFIGSNLVDYLVLDGHNVAVIDNLSHGKKEYINKKADFYQMDIRNTQINMVFKKVQPNVVFHSAAQISVSKSFENVLEDADINIIGSINVLEACKNTKVNKIIYPASAAIFGEPEYFPIDEKHPLKMLSPYGVSKHTVEHYLYVYNKLYGIRYNSLRYSNVYGPRQDSTGEGGVVAIFCENMLKGNTPIIFGSGKQTRDFIYIKDVVRANIDCMNSKKNGIYNVCTNTKTTVNDLYDVIKRKTCFSEEPIYKKERIGDILNSYMTYDKILKDMNWRPDFDIEKGIEKTIDFYKNKLTWDTK